MPLPPVVHPPPSGPPCDLCRKQVYRDGMKIFFQHEIAGTIRCKACHSRTFVNPPPPVLGGGSRSFAIDPSQQCCACGELGAFASNEMPWCESCVRALHPAEALLLWLESIKCAACGEMLPPLNFKPGQRHAGPKKGRCIACVASRRFPAKTAFTDTPLECSSCGESKHPSDFGTNQRLKGERRRCRVCMGTAALKQDEEREEKATPAATGAGSAGAPAEDGAAVGVSAAAVSSVSSAAPASNASRPQPKPQPQPNNRHHRGGGGNSRATTAALREDFGSATIHDFSGGPRTTSTGAGAGAGTGGLRVGGGGRTGGGGGGGGSSNNNRRRGNRRGRGDDLYGYFEYESDDSDYYYNDFERGPPILGLRTTLGTLLTEAIVASAVAEALGEHRRRGAGAGGGIGGSGYNPYEDDGTEEHKDKGSKKKEKRTERRKRRDEDDDESESSDGEEKAGATSSSSDLKQLPFAKEPGIELLKESLYQTECSVCLSKFRLRHLSPATLGGLSPEDLGQLFSLESSYRQTRSAGAAGGAGKEAEADSDDEVDKDEHTGKGLVVTPCRHLFHRLCLLRFTKFRESQAKETAAAASNPLATLLPAFPTLGMAAAVSSSSSTIKPAVRHHCPFCRQDLDAPAISSQAVFPSLGSNGSSSATSAGGAKAGGSTATTIGSSASASSSASAPRRPLKLSAAAAAFVPSSVKTAVAVARSTPSASSAAAVAVAPPSAATPPVLTGTVPPPSASGAPPVPSFPSFGSGVEEGRPQAAMMRSSSSSSSTSAVSAPAASSSAPSALAAEASSKATTASDNAGTVASKKKGKGAKTGGIHAQSSFLASIGKKKAAGSRWQLSSRGLLGDADDYYGGGGRGRGDGDGDDDGDDDDDDDDSDGDNE